jgi:hypothetical protein
MQLICARKKREFKFHFHDISVGRLGPTVGGSSNVQVGPLSKVWIKGSREESQSSLLLPELISRWYFGWMWLEYPSRTHCDWKLCHRKQFWETMESLRGRIQWEVLESIEVGSWNVELQFSLLSGSRCNLACFCICSSHGFMTPCSCPRQACVMWFGHWTSKNVNQINLFSLQR